MGRGQDISAQDAASKGRCPRFGEGEERFGYFEMKQERTGGAIAYKASGLLTQSRQLDGQNVAAES
jgi:hypothetical protein